jgi:formate dehydrogenase iron-sulfur subunit
MSGGNGNSNGVLVDLVRCMGCRACQVACKAWNDNPGESTLCLGCYDNPPGFSANTWSLIQFNEVEDAAGKLHWVFAKRQCMHCEHPACVSACPVQALHKLDDGPVVYDEGKCIGCRYCMVACPFNVPRIDFYDLLPVITKCNFCADRQGAELEPACVKACPTEALSFGKRDELLIEARARIEKRPDKYVNHIYGEKEAGGTSWMYLSPVPFKDLIPTVEKAFGFPELDSEPAPKLSETVAVFGTPTALLTVGATLAGVYWATKRRMEHMGESEAPSKKDKEKE